MKYKAGDKVRCISRAFTMYIQVGAVYTVKRVKGNYLVLQEIELPHAYVDSLFELVESKPKFKVGDKVRCVEDCIGIRVGREYTIVSVCPEEYWYRVVNDVNEVDGYTEDKFELVQEDVVLAPEEVFDHLRKGTKLQVRVPNVGSWWNIVEPIYVTCKDMTTKEWRIKPEPDVIELNGKKYREIVD